MGNCFHIHKNTNLFVKLMIYIYIYIKARNPLIFSGGSMPMKINT